MASPTSSSPRSSSSSASRSPSPSLQSQHHERRLSLLPPEPVSPQSAASPSMVSTPVTINGNAVPYDFQFDFQSPVAHARHAQSPFMLATPSSKKHAALALPISCTFEALSLHFHLPLKVAAEKFGVRATAFKKRCRAIGIRHWPYRKVRSLKRSLQDLARSKEDGSLTDKQNNQLASYQKQLDKLLSPETYGIDPSSGRLLAHFHDDDDDENESDDDDDCESSCGSHSSSSQMGSPYSSGGASVRSPPYKARNALRSTTRGRMSMNNSSASLAASHHYFYNMVHNASSSNTSINSSGSSDYTDVSTLNDAATMPSVSVRFATHAGHGGSGIPFEAYDPFFNDFKGGEFSLTMEDFGDEDHASCGYALDGIASHDDDFFPMLRSPTMATRRATLAAAGDDAPQQQHLQQRARSNGDVVESLEDDVFLQISPDFGCLV